MALYPEGTAPLPLDDVQRAANKANELARQDLGQNGAIVLSTANPTAPSDMYVSLTVLTATTIASVTAPGITNPSSLTAVSFPAGTIIKGDIRAVTLTSGLAILYKA
jgi:hypothetical protein